MKGGRVIASTLVFGALFIGGMTIANLSRGREPLIDWVVLVTAIIVYFGVKLLFQSSLGPEK